MNNIEALKKQLLEDPTIQNNINAANQLANVTERREAIKILRQGFEITTPLCTSLLSMLSLNMEQKRLFLKFLLA